MPRWLFFLFCSLFFSNVALAQTARTTRVRVTSEPEGAAVYVDGAMERAGTTPVTLRLTRQEHTLRLELQGYASDQRTIEVAVARQTLSFRLSILGLLEVGPADDSAQGAAVSIDGEEVGTVPLSQHLTPGRHRVSVERDGYRSLSQWFELAGGQTYNLAVTLQREQPQTGSILIAGDISGAEAFVDGQARGTTPLIVEADPGSHVVEIRPEGLQPHSEVVTVEAGGRATVNPNLRASQASGGSLLVLAEPAGATVWVDGQDRGTAPASVPGLAPGTHIVEARLPGHAGASQQVVIEADRQETIRLVLTAEPQGGSVRVISAAPGSEVLIDGEPAGQAPVSRPNLSPGEHLIVVRAAGHADWEQRINVTEGEEVVVNATPSGVARLSVTSNVASAEVLIDGAVVGTVPLTDHQVSAGQHAVEVRAEGYQAYTTSVSVLAGAAQQLAANLVAGPGGGPDGAGDGQPPDDGEPQYPDAGDDPDDDDDDRPRFAWSPIPLRPFKLAIDAGFGWPYLVGAYRVAMGVYERFDVAAEVRSTYWVTEIDVHGRIGLRLARIVGLGAEVNIGGGFGAEGRNTFTFGLTLAEGLELGPVVLALRQRLQVYSDHYLEGQPRHTGARVFIGGAVEWRILSFLHVFAVVDYAPAQDGRRAFCGTERTAEGCTHWMHDIGLEARGGLGLRFF